MEGPTLKTLRRETGAKGYEFAKALGLTPATLSRYENGKARIPRSVALAATYLNKESALSQPEEVSPEERLIGALKEVVSGVTQRAG